MVILVLILGLVFGSFLAALTYRLPKGESILHGRSFCDNCKKQINWYDNIPVLSFVLLSGKCRSCGKKISKRYPIIEILTGVLFVCVYIHAVSPLSIAPFVNLPLLFILAFTTLAIFVIDAEHQIIPDEFIWMSLFFVFLFFFAAGYQDFYERLLVSFLSAFFLLVLNLVTLGKGMGLGDVKFALLPGFLLGFPYSIIWLFLSFFLGALFGILLIVFKNVKLKQRIAFGPFLIIGFWITLFYGETLKQMLLPYLN